jgi:hypothetical protein
VKFGSLLRRSISPGRGQPILLAAQEATFRSNLIGGCRETGIFRQSTRSHKFYLNSTEITITTPPLTTILDRLIREGITLYSDSVII